MLLSTLLLYNFDKFLRMEVDIKKLIQEKDVLEQEIQNLTIEIETIATSKGYNDKLIDDEGFPKPDLDFG